MEKNTLDLSQQHDVGMIGEEDLGGAGGQLQYIRQADQRGGEGWEKGGVEQDFNQLGQIFLTREHCGEIIVELSGKR